MGTAGHGYKQNEAVHSSNASPVELLGTEFKKLIMSCLEIITRLKSRARLGKRPNTSNA